MARYRVCRFVQAQGRIHEYEPGTDHVDEELVREFVEDSVDLHQDTHVWAELVGEEESRT